jgi:hypothetical protein
MIFVYSSIVSNVQEYCCNSIVLYCSNVQNGSILCNICDALHVVLFSNMDLWCKMFVPLSKCV